jgi:tetratricopeptide (TPR) repeat protein
MEEIYKDLFFGQDKGIKAIIKNQRDTNEHWQCYIGLAFALERNIKDAQNSVNLIEEESITDHYCPILLEAKMLIAYFTRNFEDAQKFALQALELNPYAVFAHTLLAQDLLLKRNAIDAIAHYQKILEKYPEHNTTLLNMAQALYMKKESADAKKFADQAKLSVRRTLYQAMFKLSSPGIRVLWVFLALIVLAIPWFGMWFFVVTSLILFSGIMWSLLRRRDFVISALFMTVLAVHTSLAAFIWFMRR